MRALSIAALALPADRRIFWRRALARVGEWHRRARDRRTLLAMSERDLRDIGVTRCDAVREAEKPFWRG
ncbi:MAG: DUF1127 domain-containing protein [Stellaceae bacterium]